MSEQRSAAEAARVLATARVDELERRWAAWPDRPDVATVRGPETGLVMVQARIGGTGVRCNLGEATVTRATVRLRGGGIAADALGTAYVLGGDERHAELAAIFTAMLGDERLGPIAEADVIAPLAAALAGRDAHERARARATVVDFFTVAREHLTDDEDET